MSKLNKLNKKIAEHIILAQVASDGGKCLHDIRHIFGDKSDDVWEYGYQVKDNYIFAAIQLICRSHSNFYRYSVSEIGAGRYLVYFSFKLNDGKRYQVSFHSFNENLEKFAKTSKVTRWDKKSSREACVKLKEQFFN